MPMALLKRRIKVWELPLNWFLVFFGNLAGALCFTAFMGKSPKQNHVLLPTVSALQRPVHSCHEDLLRWGRSRED